MKSSSIVDQRNIFLYFLKEILIHDSRTTTGSFSCRRNIGRISFAEQSFCARYNLYIFATLKYSYIIIFIETLDKAVGGAEKEFKRIQDVLVGYKKKIRSKNMAERLRR